jgi:cellulose biosynthesis protein BcsQ
MKSRAEKLKPEASLSPPVREDIQAICAEAGFAPGQYKVFPRKQPAGDTSTSDLAALHSRLNLDAVAAPQPVAAAAPALVVAKAGLSSSAAQPLPAPAPSPVFAAAPAHPPAPSPVRQDSRRGLRAALEDRRASRTEMLARTLVFAPAAGGMGCTTLVATLARLFQSRSEPALLLDDRADGMLDLHFEAANHPAVPVLSRANVATLAGSWFLEPLGSHQREYRWMLLDSSSLGPATVAASLASGAVCLVPVAANVRGVRAAVRLCDQLDAYEAESGKRPACYFVLNQFQHGSAFQEELRQHLANRLGARFAPVAVRWSEEVEQALAEGMTVLDYAPDSEVARDFGKLGEWLAGLA